MTFASSIANTLGINVASTPGIDVDTAPGIAPANAHSINVANALGIENPSGTAFGWRIWSVDTTEDAVLRSPYVESRVRSRIGVPWTETSIRASCSASDHTPPGANCSCGVYADPDNQYANTARRLLKMAVKFHQETPHLTLILGRVELAGDVVLDTTFIDPRNDTVFPEYRAETATIRQLWVPHLGLVDDPGALAVELGAKYSVPTGVGVPPKSLIYCPTATPGHIPVVKNPNLLIVPVAALPSVVDQITAALEGEGS
ncbi:hypothetical protein ACFVKB_05080 [Rhodococcus sp. NPDC127530]|uniref:hypothetical protein n=1 Tax=unclassified Rhodococcus (in: high G+C Gram-positive bacteria) TaxID=192944 RepID=UPI003629C84E